MTVATRVAVYIRAASGVITAAVTDAFTVLSGLAKTTIAEDASVDSNTAAVLLSVAIIQNKDAEEPVRIEELITPEIEHLILGEKEDDAVIRFSDGPSISNYVRDRF